MQNLLSPIIGKFDSVVTKVLKTGINASSSSNIIVDVICLPTKHLGVLKNLLKCVRAFWIVWEFGSVGF